MDALDPILDALAGRLAPKVAAALAQMPNDDRLLTVAEAAERCGLSGQSIRRLVKANVIPRVKGLAEIRIRLSSLANVGK